MSFLILSYSCNKVEPTKFSEESLNEIFVDLDGSKLEFREILDANKGKKIVIDIWASWCRDCIKGFPELKKLQKANPEVVFVFLSQDRSATAWKDGIEKHILRGEHYFMPSGWDGPFVDFIDLDWIPRYMVIDENGSIAVFDVVKSDDKRLIEALK